MICAHQNAEISNQNYHLDAVSIFYTVSHSLPNLFPTISSNKFAFAMHVFKHQLDAAWIATNEPAPHNFEFENGKESNLCQNNREM